MKEAKKDCLVAVGVGVEGKPISSVLVQSLVGDPPLNTAGFTYCPPNDNKANNKAEQ